MGGLLNNLKFQILVLASSILLRRAQSRSLRFQQMLHEETFVLQVCTDAGIAAFYRLQGGALQVRLGHHPKPDFTQTWVNSREAVRAMLSKDETDILRALEAGKCRMQGRFNVALWLNEAMKIARSV